MQVLSFISLTLCPNKNKSGYYQNNYAKKKKYSKKYIFTNSFPFCYTLSQICYPYYSAVINSTDKKDQRSYVCYSNKHYLIGIKKILEITCKIKQKSKRKRKKEEKHKSFSIYEKAFFY